MAENFVAAVKELYLSKKPAPHLALTLQGVSPEEE
jgi:hypothetical protein